ncbi:unnamed protein product, partial [Protopolystoma xenopodis]
MKSRIHLPENVPLGTEVLDIIIEENSDFSLNSHIIYGIEAIGTEMSDTFALSKSESQSKYTMLQAFLLKPRFSSIKGSGILLSQNGVHLIVASPLDRERVSAYRILLLACDLDTPPLCVSHPLTIFLDDVNDNAPIFLTPSLPRSMWLKYVDYSEDILDPSRPINIPENNLIPSKMGRIVAFDLDINDEVRYHLANYKDTFKINRRTGRISLKRTLDFENQAVFDLVVVAEDRSRRRSVSPLLADRLTGVSSGLQTCLSTLYSRLPSHRSASVLITVLVQDLNDNPPVFISPGRDHLSRPMLDTAGTNIASFG